MKNFVILLFVAFSHTLFAQSKFQALQVAYKLEFQGAHLNLPPDLENSITKKSFETRSHLVNFSFLFEADPKVAVKTGVEFGLKSIKNSESIDGFSFSFSWGPSPKVTPIRKIEGSHWRTAIQTSLVMVLGGKTLHQNHFYFETGLNYCRNFNHSYKVDFSSSASYDSDLEEKFLIHLNKYSSDNQLSLQAGFGGVFHFSPSLRLNLNFITMQQTIQGRSAIVYGPFPNHEHVVGIQYRIK